MAEEFDDLSVEDYDGDMEGVEEIDEEGLDEIEGGWEEGQEENEEEGEGEPGVRWENEDGEEEQSYMSDELEESADDNHRMGNEEVETKVTKKMREEHKKAQSVGLLSGCWKQMAESFGSEGKQLMSANRLPIGQKLKHFELNNELLKTETFTTKLSLIALMSDLQQLRSRVSPDRETPTSFLSSLSGASAKTVKKSTSTGIVHSLLSTAVDTDLCFTALEKGLTSRLSRYCATAEEYLEKTRVMSGNSANNKVRGF